jgi:uncharacterized membrane protein YuzA (DUF378 family)
MLSLRPLWQIKTPWNKDLFGIFSTFWVIVRIIYNIISMLYIVCSMSFFELRIEKYRSKKAKIMKKTGEKE